MLRFGILFAVIFMGLVPSVLAEEEVQKENDRKNLAVEIARDHVDVTVGFAGTSVEIFGDRRDKKTDVAIVLTGPLRDITIWKKERVMGTWVNRYFMSYKNMPIYYHYALSSEKDDKKTQKMLLENNIGYDAILKNVKRDYSPAIKDFEIYDTALLTKKRYGGVYFDDSANIMFLNDNFFRLRFMIPPSAPTGEYTVHSYLIRDGVVKQHSQSSLIVEQVGLNAFLYNAARDYSLVYALVCIVIGLFSGWLVSVLKVRP